jgi:hypothetical protein
MILSQEILVQLAYTLLRRDPNIEEAAVSSTVSVVADRGSALAEWVEGLMMPLRSEPETSPNLGNSDQFPS